jgi:hypothetical protein
VRVR